LVPLGLLSLTRFTARAFTVSFRFFSKFLTITLVYFIWKSLPLGELTPFPTQHACVIANSFVNLANVGRIMGFDH